MTGAVVPKVSVVLRTYNHGSFIAQAIESVLIQRTDFPIELVIGEDCSTDETRDLVAEYAERNPDLIKTILPAQNVGHNEIFRLALDATAGTFVAYLDGDDYWTSAAKLQHQVDFLEANSDCASCFHDASLIYDEAGLPSGTTSPGLVEDRFTLEQILMECFVPSPTVMFRKEVAGGLPTWAFDSDWIYWLIHVQSARIGQIGYLPEALAAYRVHKGGMFSGLDRVSQLEEDLSFYERLLPELPEQAELIERCVAYRHAQLAIERLGVPFDACVVQIDPRRELRPYFNGRHARSLPRLEGHELTELEAIREAAVTLPPAVRDYGSQGDEVPDGSHACYVAVPAGAADWFAQHPKLQHYLEQHGQVAWEDDWVVIHELAPVADDERTGSADGARRRVDFTMLELDDEIAGSYLDAPTLNALMPAHAVSVVGWVLGSEQLATAVEFKSRGELIWRAPVRVERPDIAEAFSDLSVTAPGFETTLNVDGLPEDSRVEISAILADGSAHPFAELRFS